MKCLKFDSKFKKALIEEIKTSTIRRHTDLQVGECFILGIWENLKRVKIKFKIVEIKRIRFDEINKEIAYTEGYLHEDLLKDELSHIYDDLENSTLLYYIKFKKLDLVEEDEEEEKIMKSNVGWYDGN